MTDKELLCQFPNKCEECGQYLSVDCDDCKNKNTNICNICMYHPNLENHYKPK